jgi:hypothetical protein
LGLKDPQLILHGLALGGPHQLLFMGKLSSAYEKDDLQAHNRCQICHVGVVGISF